MTTYLPKMKRRKFLQETALAGSAFMLAPGLAHARSISPNDKLQVGVIGCNGMGWANVRSILNEPDVDLVAMADVDPSVLTRRLVDYASLRTNRPETYSDYRDLLARKDIDAVIIGTPDHWHCKMMIDAVNAGKHVYVEKPVANTIQECNLMTEAAKRTGKVVQTGQWQRSGPHYREAIDLVQSGQLGAIRLVKVWAYQGWMGPLQPLPDGPVPEGVDYDMWLGPAPKRAFNPNRFHFNFRWYWDYAGGLMTDWGVHEIDIALYAMKAKAPLSVMASGGKIAYPEDPMETPDTLQSIYRYDGFSMLWEHAMGIDNGPYQRREGIAFIGNNGTLVVDRNGYEVLIERESGGYNESRAPKMAAIPPVKKPEEVRYLDLHTRNFVEAIKANNPALLNTPIDSGSIAAINAQMGNIAYRTGNKLFWDASSGTFGENKSANTLINAKYHNGWKLPVI